VSAAGWESEARSGTSAVRVGVLGMIAGAVSGALTTALLVEMKGTAWLWLIPGATFTVVVGGTMGFASPSFRRVAFAWIPLVLAAWPVAFWWAVALVDRVDSAVVMGAGAGLLGGAFIGWGNGLFAAARARAFWATTVTGGAAGALLFLPFAGREWGLHAIFVGWQALVGAVTGACAAPGPTGVRAVAGGATAPRVSRFRSFDGGPLR
jgi:hypothetical protein